MATLMRNETSFADFGFAIDAFTLKNSNGGALSSSGELANSIHDAFEFFYAEHKEAHGFDHTAIRQAFFATDCKIRLAYNRDGVQGGYIVLNGELMGLFAEKGLGSWILNHAINDGAVILDCFDGFLPKFYAKHGFVEFKRAANWVKGEPDVVYMKRTAN